MVSSCCKMNIEKTGFLGYIVDHTTQLCGDYNKPVEGSLLNNQCNGQ